jgi:hypothetical protein
VTRCGTPTDSWAAIERFICPERPIRRTTVQRNVHVPQTNGLRAMAVCGWAMPVSTSSDDGKRSRLGYACTHGAQGMGELVQLFDDVRIGDQGDAENSGVGQCVEGDADVAWVHRGRHHG